MAGGARRWGAAASAGAVLLAALLGGCDGIARRELKPGESTRDDVVRLMGKPQAVREADGRTFLLYPRAPEGHETWLVEIGPDGRYRGMRNLLTPENFARVRPGMRRDEVRELLGPPAEEVRFDLKRETVWSYRHLADQRRAKFFNVHFADDGQVRSTSASPDPKAIGP